MAVVSISRIQIRRGKKNSGSGLPQLASGEFGWAIDTQQLYIGNGSVSEGAPAVGNTEILTESTDLFALISDYIYKKNEGYIQTGPSVNSPIERSLQERLDERVSVRSFGAYGDGSQQKQSLQRAIDQLYLNSATKGNARSRVVLHIEAGRYVTDGTVYLPPYTTIKGAGSEKTIIECSADVPVFKTVNGNSTPGSPASDSTTTTLNQAKYLSLEGMTIKSTNNNTSLQLYSCSDSRFVDLKIQGPWASGDALDADSIGIRMQALSSAVTSQRNEFVDVEVTGFSYAVESIYDILDNSFSHCIFRVLGYGFVYGNGTNGANDGQLVGPLNNTVLDSQFRDIDRNAIWVATGTGNASQNNHFYSVGNNGGTEGNAVYSIIKYDQEGNVTDNDYFDRTSKLSYSQDYILNTPYVPEVSGVTMNDMNFFQLFEITQTNSPVRMFKLPAEASRVYRIDYWYKSEVVNATRHGVLEITIDRDDNSTELVDEYNYEGNPTFNDNLVFEVNLTDEDADTNIDTLVVSYTNPTSADTAKFMYRVTTFSIS